MRNNVSDNELVHLKKKKKNPRPKMLKILNFNSKKMRRDTPHFFYFLTILFTLRCQISHRNVYNITI